jgi:acyl-CoA dehydrogenase
VEALTRARTFLRTAARRQPGQTQPGAHRLMHAAGLLDGMQARLRTLIDQFDATYALGSDRAVADPQETGWPQGMARATVLNMLKHDVSTQAHEVVLEALRICGMAGYRNGTEFSIGRHLRDILSAQLMINNDRIASGTGAMLFAQRAELGTL